MRIVFWLIALRKAPFEVVMPVLFSVLVQHQTVFIAVKQVLVVDSLFILSTSRSNIFY